MITQSKTPNEESYQLRSYALPDLLRINRIPTEKNPKSIVSSGIPVLEIRSSLNRRSQQFTGLIFLGSFEIHLKIPMRLRINLEREGIINPK